MQENCKLKCQDMVGMHENHDILFWIILKFVILKEDYKDSHKTCMHMKM